MALLQNVVQRGTHAARPAAGSAGVLYFETDTGQLFRDSGSAWQLDDSSLLYTAKGQLLVATGSGTLAALAVGADNQVLVADSGQSSGVKWAAAPAGSGGALSQVSQTVLSAAAANITFSSIPGSYSSLVLMVQARGDTAAQTTGGNLQLNGDTAANYDYILLYGQNSVAAEAESFLATSFEFMPIPAASATANRAAEATITLVNYAGTTFHKSLHSSGGYICNDVTTNAASRQYTGIWKSTAAITSIKLFPATGNFVAGTVATLYGLS